MSEHPASIEREHTEFRLTVIVGEPASPGGSTRVRVDPAGQLYAEQVFAAGDVSADTQTEEIIGDRGEITDRASGELTAVEAATIFRLVSQLPWGQPPPTRPGVPPEAISNWTLTAANGARLTLRMWLRDAEQHATVGPLLAEINRQLFRIARGAIVL